MWWIGSSCWKIQNQLTIRSLWEMANKWGQLIFSKEHLLWPQEIRCYASDECSLHIGVYEVHHFGGQVVSKWNECTMESRLHADSQPELGSKISNSCPKNGICCLRDLQHKIMAIDDIEHGKRKSKALSIDLMDAHELLGHLSEAITWLTMAHWGWHVTGKLW